MELRSGVLPIDNSASGSLHETYDLLVQHDVVIAAELGVSEVYCLCAPSGTQVSEVARVLSHPRILEACSGFLEARLSNPNLVATRNTTTATRIVNEGLKGPSGAQAPPSLWMVAIATREAAEIHGLDVIAEDIGNDHHLQTRYILIRQRASPVAGMPPPFPHDLTLLNPLRKRSAAFVLKNEPGSLFKLLSCWALRNMNVIKVEGRPIQGDAHDALAGSTFLFDFLLHIDFEVPPWQTDEEAARLWEALTEFSVWQRDFGSYPSHVMKAVKEEQSWDEMVDAMTKG